jgi:hypothetical protein
MRTVERVGLWAILVLLALHMVFSARAQDRLEERIQVCHSTSEDSTPYDCEYEGDDNSWTRK